MTIVNVVASWATSVNVDIGEIDPEEAFEDDFPHQEFHEAVVGYLDSLSEEELRELYRGPEAIGFDDPIYEEHDSRPTVSMDTQENDSEGD